MEESLELRTHRPAGSGTRRALARRPAPVARVPTHTRCSPPGILSFSFSPSRVCRGQSGYHRGGAVALRGSFRPVLYTQKKWSNAQPPFLCV